MRQATLLLSALLAATVAVAAAAATPDAGIRAHLEAKKTPFTVDEDGDFRINVNFKDEGRTQRVFVRSSVRTLREHRVRELWSYAHEGDSEVLPEALANRLLEANLQTIRGGWVKQERNVMFVLRIDPDASAEELDEAIDYAAAMADDLEKDLSDGGDAL